MSRHPILSIILKSIHVLSLAIAAIGAYLLRFASAEPLSSSIVGTIARFFDQYSWVLVVLPGIAWVANHFSNKLRTNWLLSVIQSVLTQFCDQMFGALGGGKDEHRATLFVHQKFALWRTLPWRMDRHPWSGWLVPVARSGHATQIVRSRFLAPDKAARAEGFAGLTWRTRSINTIINLPDLSSASPEGEMTSYSHKTKISMAWLRGRLEQNEELPRALRGIPVEVDNALWGVIVLDSREPAPFGVDPDGQGPLTRMFSFTISKLLERVRV